MVDVTEHIRYWRTGGDEDFAEAESLLKKGHLRQSLFFAHLAVEKMLNGTRHSADRGCAATHTQSCSPC